jgi:hypothetical protein
MNRINGLALLVLSLTLLWGCAPRRVHLPPAGPEVRVWDLLERFDEYTVSYYHHVGPTAIVFDRIADPYEVRLTGPYWSRVQTRDELHELIRVMQEGYRMGSSVRVVALAANDGRVAAGYLFTPGLARVRSGPEAHIVEIDQVWKEMACHWHQTRFFFGDRGLCYTEDHNGDDRVLFR